MTGTRILLSGATLADETTASVAPEPMSATARSAPPCPVRTLPAASPAFFSEVSI